MVRKLWVVMSPRSVDTPLHAFECETDAMRFFGDLYPTRHDATKHVREVMCTDGYLGMQRKRDVAY